MKKKTVLWLNVLAGSALVGALFDLAGLASLAVLAIAFWLSLVALGLYLVWWLVFALGFRRWRPKTSLFTGPLKGVAIAASGVVGSGLAAPPATLPRDTPIDRQFSAMLTSDQSDRWSGRFVTMPWRDRRRLERTRELLASDPSLKPHTAYAAAMILQHGTRPADFQKAHELAKAAHYGGVTEAEWLAKATFDRWQLSLGKPQKYGTQSNVTIGIGGVKKEKQ